MLIGDNACDYVASVALYEPLQQILDKVRDCLAWSRFFAFRSPFLSLRVSCFRRWLPCPTCRASFLLRVCFRGRSRAVWPRCVRGCASTVALRLRSCSAAEQFIRQNSLECVKGASFLRLSK